MKMLLGNGPHEQEYDSILILFGNRNSSKGFVAGNAAKISLELVLAMDKNPMLRSVVEAAVFAINEKEGKDFAETMAQTSQEND